MQTAYYDAATDTATFQVRTDPVDHHEDQDWGAVFYFSRDHAVVKVEIRNAAEVLPEELVTVLEGPRLACPSSSRTRPHPFTSERIADQPDW